MISPLRSFIAICLCFAAAICPGADTDLFQQAAGIVAARKSFLCDLASTTTNNVQGKLQATTSTAKLYVKRPRMLLMVSQLPGYGLLICSNGVNRLQFRPALNRYYEEPLDAAPDAHFQPIQNQFGNLVSELLDTNSATPNLTVESHQTLPLTFTAQTGNQLHTFEINPDSKTLQKYTAETTSPFQKSEIGFTWNLDMDLDDKTFAFRPPPTAQRVSSFANLLNPEPAATTSTLVIGSDAPDVTFATLSGKSVRLATLQGTGPVILDFWATWCHGCPKALAGLNQIESEFKESSVTLFAINAREDKAKVEEFLAANNLQLDAGLDTTGTVAAAFGVRKVPQSVIINSAGKIHSVHVGHGPETEKEIREQLLTLTRSAAPQPGAAN